MKNTKKTKRDFYNELLNLEVVKANAEQVAFIKHELELLDKKHKKDKPTKAQEENIKIKEDIVNYLIENEKAITISELCKVPSFSNFTNQKLSALMKQLVDNGDVVRTEEKRVAYFQIA